MGVIMPERTRPTEASPKNECISSKQADHSCAWQISERDGVSINGSDDPVTIFALWFYACLRAIHEALTARVGALLRLYLLKLIFCWVFRSSFSESPAGMIC